MFVFMNAMSYWITINIEWLSVSSNYLTKGRDINTHKLKRMHENAYMHSEFYLFMPYLQVMQQDA